ncbi:alpha-amylase family glycosyl hydrolase [Coraliomargarita sp. SDUM461004]|uniref:Alpha-amylase family glycosyl hydrolase n=1 Tax=Thalassobacterium sedimentorum TaxID=3041258 RepID=A0ABU1AFM1_9BACT|nr:alpha-amylase family glycosyl hydrolase [Coraliomargarita sp. SDUM461004]MDQ8193354.1 alpha-amylase family glycosyl hydrolase [Coraliomargarita sp. SDUM461004]
MAKKTQQIANAFWESSETGLIFLSSDWGSTTTLPPLLLGPKEQTFSKLERLSPEECGRFCRYYRRKNSWVFTVRSNRHPQLLDRKVRVFLGGDFNQWEAAIGQSQWELKPNGDAAETSYELRVPLKLIPSGKQFAFKFVTDQGEWLDVPDSAPNRIERNGVSNFSFQPELTGSHIFRFYTPDGYEPMGNEKIIWRSAEQEEVHELPHTQFLTAAKTDLELGAIVSEECTTFRLFAPRASAVKLCYGQKADGSDALVLSMKCLDACTWELQVTQNLDGYYYSYRVEGVSVEGTSHFDPNFAVLDPYAKACLGRRGPGIVVAPERMAKVAVPFTPPAWHDLVIMEAHVRDLAAHAPIELTAQERTGYAGLRKWLKAEGSYLKEIGVNAVELQPIQEFDNEQASDYHWGYMTVNYFSPESSYAAAPERASQIEEFRGLVEDFHREGMAVIIDVVYNHVGEPNHLLFIDKFYYFHLDQGNDLMNWSGCGNDLRCDTAMGRRLIIDSLKHLVETYDVDGFRFDLAELIGIEVLREIEVELKQVKPSLILIAEPWSFRGHIQKELKETGFASWNDGYRECISKYVKGEGSQDIIRHFLAGSPGTTRFAAQTINYTESHDDHCWLDRITERPKCDGTDPTLLDRRRTHLMASLLFSSLGVPMLAEGQDFLRSKRGISNTYQRGDVNALDYNRRFVYSGTHGYFRAWIRFRLSDLGQAFRYDGGLSEGYLKFFFVEGASAAVVLFNADRSVDAPQLVYGINPHLSYADIECIELQPQRLKQIADQERFCLEGIDSARIPLSETRINLPPLTCGLWLVR